MAGWAGFSDEELRRLQQKEQTTAGVVGRGRKTAPTNRSRQQLQRERVLQLASQKQQDGAVPILPEQQLAKPKAQAPRTTQEPPGSTSSHQQEPVAVSQPVVATTETSPVPMAKELETQEVELREKTRLEQLQQEQRIIEEKNKRKKALLAKTIAEKSKQTQAEAVKLKRIQKELQALDDMVSNDIGILRGRIEQASWDYSTAR
ncbi:RAB6-interacting golgin [Megalops cyprinoides]|uniref:RAB6-interacting golgin n=1 Tax=Megalops cyprinoides TaxID=118141 RepID=UPI001863A098|nr:RAB6-interacting golgin [Megalops cyprinoides]